MKTKYLITLTLFSLLLTSCMAGTPEPSPSAMASVAPAPRFTGPGYAVTGMPEPPSPTAVSTTVSTPTASGHAAGMTESPSSTIASTTTVATSISPGWTRYDSINRIHDLAFAPDSTLWAVTGGGLVHWDLSTDTYTRYLIQATHMDVASDSTLWLATGYGICHFDGTTCRAYTDADGLIHNAVRAVAVAPDGVVWLGTEGGVSRFDGESWKGYPSPVPTQDLAIAASGEVWAATARGVGRYMPSQDVWTTYTEEHGLPGLQAQVIATGPEGDVWAYILWHGIYRFDGENWQKVVGVSGGRVADIAFAADGTPWVAAVGGTHYPGGHLAYRAGDTWTDVTSEHGLMSIGAVALGPGEVVAAGTNLGLGIYQGGEWRLLKDGPTHDRVTSIAVTPDGAAWFGFGDHSVSTPGGGLSRFDGRNWHYFLDDAEVNVLAVGPDGSLWAGVGCEVQRYDGIAWETVVRCGEDLPAGNVTDIAFTPDGAAWIANGFALARFDGQSWTVYDKLINSLEVAPDGAIWMNGWEGLQGSFYVARFDGENWTIYKSADSFPGAFLVHAVTPDGLVWGTIPEGRLASFDGQSWTDGRSWTFHTTAGSLPLDNIRGLAVAPDGALWVVTSGGVGRFDGESISDGTWTPYTPDNDLTGSIGNTIAFAPGSAIWFGTTRFQPAQVERIPTPAPLPTPTPVPDFKPTRPPALYQPTGWPTDVSSLVDCTPQADTDEACLDDGRVRLLQTWQEPALFERMVETLLLAFRP